MDRIRLNGTGKQAREEQLRQQAQDARDTADMLLWAVLIACCVGGLGWTLWLLEVLR